VRPGLVLAEDRSGLVATGSTPSEQSIEQAKMIAHEIRNALIPARHRIDAVRGTVPESQRDVLDKTRRGIVRVLTFVDELMAASDLVAEAATPFELLALVRGAQSMARLPSS